MDELSRYRAVAVEVSCPNLDRPFYWESHTTLTDAELKRYAQRWPDGMGEQGRPQCEHLHAVSIIEIPQTSTGARRG